MKILDLYLLKKRTLVLAGAMGSYLQKLNYAHNDKLWSARAIMENPSLITKLHLEYISAGADIITTNTFRTNPISLKFAGHSYKSYQMAKIAVQLAKTAADGKDVVIGGSNAPAEDCYQPERTISVFDLDYNHKTHISILYESGVDVIWNETFSHLDEIKTACSFCSKNEIPFVISLLFDADLRILSGENIFEVLDIVYDYNPAAIGFNCISYNNFLRLMAQFEKNYLWGFYLNVLNEDRTKNSLSPACTANEYSQRIKNYFGNNLLFVGSCCGSDPEFTKSIKESLFEINSN